MMRPGMGSTDVSALAAAMASHSVHPTYLDPMWQPSYSTTPELLPGQLCLDDATSQQIAALLGGQVIQAPAQNLQGVVPNCNWIRLPDGTVVRAADIAQVASEAPSIYGLSELCGYEQMLSMGIPGGMIGADCGASPTSGFVPGSGSASYTPPAPAPPAGTPALPNVVPPSILGGCPSGYVYFPSINVPGSTIAAFCQLKNPATVTPPPAGSVASGTPGSNAGSGAGSGSGSGGTGSGQQTSDTVVAGFDISQIPWWAWLAGGGVLLVALGGHK